MRAGDELALPGCVPPKLDLPGLEQYGCKILKNTCFDQVGGCIPLRVVAAFRVGGSKGSHRVTSIVASTHILLYLRPRHG